MNMIETTQYYVKQRMLTEIARGDAAYRYTHTLRVAELGRRIARAEGLDEEMLVLACLLHDIGYVNCKTQEDYNYHGRLSADIARKFLLGVGYDAEKTESICYGILIHTLEEEKFPRPATILELSVADADNIDRFDAYRLYEGLRWAKPEEMTISELLAMAERKAKGHKDLRTYPFATETARKMWNEKLDLCVEYYQRLARQMEVTLAWDSAPETI